jgi:hypothetical protein
METEENLLRELLKRTFKGTIGEIATLRMKTALDGNNIY